MAERARGFLEERREALAASDAPVNGIAGIEVDRDDPTILRVTFVKNLPGAADPAPPAGDPPGPGDISITGGDRSIAVNALTTAADGATLTVTVDHQGDFSTYTLAIQDDVPGYDPILRAIDFSFRLDCDADLDCQAPPMPPMPPPPEPRIDYMARDYESFRQAILDRMATLAPEWTDRNAADIGVTLVELMAYLGDRLSYRNDLIDTEATLETARLRASAARHARLVGYRMGQGVSARAFVQVALAEGVGPQTLPATALQFATRTGALGRPVVSPPDLARTVNAGAAVFEPRHAVRLVPGNHRLHFHDWGDADAVLRKGATGAWLRDPGSLSDLRAGDVLALVQRRDPVTGRAADADPARRHAVRLIADPVVLADPLEPTAPDPAGGGDLALRILRVEWGPGDAPPFDLAIGRSADDPQPAEALGNIVVADHGYTLPETEDLGEAPSLVDPEDRPAEGAPDELKELGALDRPRRFRPRLKRPDLTFSAPLPTPGTEGLQAFDPLGTGPEVTLNPSEAGPMTVVAVPIHETAAALARPDAVKAVAHALLNEADPDGPYRAAADLLGATESSRLFVPEVEADGVTRLRFGDDSLGRRPNAGETFAARYRVGTGLAGNVGADAIAHVAAEGPVAALLAGARNPLPARGGARRETVAEVRKRAPVSFRELKRAVTLDDYETLLAAHPQVQRAQARKRWIGSWSAIFLTVDRVGGGWLTDELRAALLAYLEPFRMMGNDLAIDEPIYRPLELELLVCVREDHFAEDVAEAVEGEFSTGYTLDGRRGFFHPDEITFSSTIYLSRLYERALAVDGVRDVSVRRFQQAGRPATSGLESGVLSFGRREIPLLANDPNRPGQGSLTIATEGGR